MGKRIDGIMAVLVSALAAYVYYLALTGRVWLSLLLAGATVLALKRVAAGIAGLVHRLRRPGKRQRARSARQRVEGWVEASEADAAGDVAHLLARAYPQQISVVNGRLIHRATGALVPMAFFAQRAPLSGDDVLRAWKAHRGAENLVVVSTAPLASGASPAHLRSPRVTVVDRPVLERLAAKHLDVIVPTRAPSARRSAGWLRRMTDRKKAPRYLLYGALMLGIYLLAGTGAYLAAGLAMLLLAGLGFHRAAAPEKLL